MIIDTTKAIEFWRNELLSNLESRLEDSQKNDGIKDVKLINEDVIVTYEKPMITENQDILGVLLKGGAIKIASDKDADTPLKDSRAFAKFIIPVINGSNLNPTITFQLLAPSLAEGQTPGGYFKKYQQNKDNPEMFERTQNLLVYSLVYRVTMWASKRQDMDILLYQAASSAPFNNKYSTQVDGQWAEMQVTNIVNETNLDPGESQDLAIRYSFEIKIPRAYLPLDYEEYYGIIKSTDVTMDI